MPATLTTGERRVLVVDDNETILSVLTDFLQGTYVVETASNAAGAQESIADNPPTSSCST